MNIQTFEAILKSAEGMQDIKVEPAPVELKVRVFGPVFVYGIPYVFEVEIDAEDIDDVTPPLVLEFAANVRKSINIFTKRRTADPHEMPMGSPVLH